MYRFKDIQACNFTQSQVLLVFEEHSNTIDNSKKKLRPMALTQHSTRGQKTKLYDKRYNKITAL